MAAADERRSRRWNVVRAAAIQCDAGRMQVRINNISAHGALVTAKAILRPDTEIAFTCNGRTVTGWVAWARDGLAGIQFAESVDPQHWRRSEASAHQLITRDTRTIDSRRPGFRGNQLTDGERLMIEQWAGS